ncbi:MAG: MXAN_6521/LA_1396 family lipoprotein [Deltaproteobacteria bacterium]|nr:MXAN_6521/LA_1396 family lipoprotein [Deltaproteobacteria bacterium]
MRRIVGWLLLWGATACGVVRHSETRADYQSADRTQTVRIGVHVHPLPDGRQDVGELWATIAQRYTNHHRDFIAKEAVATATVTPACHDDLEGLLVITPSVRAVGDGFEVEASARLTRCRDGETVWTAQGGGSFPSRDETVLEVTRRYGEELGPSVEPYVAPSFHVLRALLDTLPEPQLPSEDAVLEKIELAD